MNHYRLLLLPVLAAPALLSLGAQDTRIELKVTEGALVKRTFTSRAELNLDSMDMKMNGQPPPMMPDMTMTLTTEITTVVEDEFLAGKDGRVTRLKRHYADLTQEMDMAMEMDMMGQTQSQNMSTTSASELEGETVLFVYDEGSSDYKARWPEAREGKDELLKGLVQDMDLTGFLPQGAVKPDQRWSVDPKAFMAIMAPGGDLKLIPESMDREQMSMMGPQTSPSDWFGDSLTGTVSATFEGLREEDARKLALIRIRFDVKNAVDMSELMKEAMDNLPPEVDGMEYDHMDMEIQYQGEGQLLWDVERGIARSFDLSGDFGMLMDMGMAVDAGGMSMNIQMTMEMSGTLSQAARFE